MAGDDTRSRGPPWLLPLAIWATAFAARLLFLGTQVHGDEAIHFYVARHGPVEPDHVFPFTMWAPIWWQRPLFALALWPGTLWDLTAYRILHAALSAAGPVLLFLLLRQLRVVAPIAAGAAAVGGLHPRLASWGLLGFPDALMTALVLAAVLAHVKGRIVLAPSLMLLAVWVKEVAFVPMVAMAALHLWRARCRGEAGLWPLRLDRPTTAWAAAVLVAPGPLLVAVAWLGGSPPGWSTSPASWSQLDSMFVSSWLLVPLLAGLAWRHSRNWTLLALLMPAFYALYQWTGRGVEDWYHILPGFLALLATAVALDTWRRRATRPRPRWAASAGVAGVALLLAVAVIAPASMTGKTLATPFSGAQESLLEGRDRLAAAHDLDDVTGFMHDDHWDVVFLVDVGWFYVAYPFAERADIVGYAYSEYTEAMDAWIEAIEQNGNITVLKVEDKPLNRAIRAVYDDCRVFASGDYVLIEGQRCSGRGDLLRDALEQYEDSKAPPR